MSNPNVHLTKTCRICAQQKPLSAFLQLTDSQETTYGNVCSTCRKTTIENLSSPNEESTTSTTGVKLDSKAKVQGEIDKRELRKQVEDKHFDERDKKNVNRINQNQKVVSKAQSEKKYRSLFENRTIPQKSSPSDSTPVFGGEEQKAEANKLDFKAPEDTRFAGKIKHTTAIFQGFKALMGTGSGTISAAERALKQKKPTEKPEMAPLNEYIKKKR